MHTVMFSFSVTPTESNIEIVAQILGLLGKLDSPTSIHLPASTSEVTTNGIVIEKVEKAKKVRKPLNETDFE